MNIFRKYKLYKMDIEPYTSLINGTNFTSTLSVGVLFCTSISSALSIIGSVIIFITYALIPESKNQTRRLLIYLTIADLMNCCGNLLGAIRYSIKYGNNDLQRLQDCLYSSEICVFQSFLTTYSSMASFFWTFFIALHLYLSVVYQSDWMIKTKTKAFCHVFSWGIPLVITLTATFYDVLGEDYSIGSGAWCWIKGCLNPPYLMTIWMTVSGKGWEIMTYISTFSLYVYLKVFMFKERRRHGRIGFTHMCQNLRDEDENFVFIWLVLYVLRIWGTARYFIAVTKIHSNYYLPIFDDADKVLIYFQSIGDSGQAFCNCIIFCFLDKTVRNGLISKFRTHAGHEQMVHVASDEQQPLIHPNTVNVN